MKKLLLALVIAGIAAGAFNAGADDKGKATGKPKPYPLDKCVVSDEKLGEHGKPYAFVHEGQEIKLCCKDCLKQFKKDPAKYTAKLSGDKSKK